VKNSLLLGQKILFKKEVHVKCSSVLGGGNILVMSSLMRFVVCNPWSM